MGPCTFVKISISALALRLPVASKPATSRIHSACAPCFCEIKLPNNPTKTIPLPLLLQDSSAPDSHRIAATFYLDETAFQRQLAVSWLGRTKTANPCLEVAIYSGKGRNCGIGSDKQLGKFRIGLDVKWMGSSSVEVHNGWVCIGKSKAGELHLDVRAEPDPRFVFQFVGQPEALKTVLRFCKRKEKFISLFLAASLAVTEVIAPGEHVTLVIDIASTQQTIVRIDTPNSQNQRILNLDTLADNGVYWKGVDVLVFESSHWWQDQRWDLIMANNQLYTNMDPLVAYKRALTTWANWIPANIDPKKSLVFFSTSSPTHYSPIYCNQKNGQKCYGQIEPVQFEGYSPPVIPQVPIVKELIGTMIFPVTLLDITGLSLFRKDGHPSIYSSTVTSDEKQHPEQFADCSHWCLPGVLDTWNELLYVTLLSKGVGN